MRASIVSTILVDNFLSNVTVVAVDHREIYRSFVSTKTTTAINIKEVVSAE